MERHEILDHLYRRDFGDTAYERDVLASLPPLLASVKTFVDVGACLGTYTCLANAHLQGGRIVAIEADPVRFDELKRNCERWQTGSSNTLVAVHAALANADGRIGFWTTNSPVDGGIFRPDISYVGDDLKGTVRWEEVSVPCFTLDTLFKDGSPDLVKVDVEGSELRILHGSTRILREGRTRFLLEIHDWPDPEGQQSGDDVVRFMNSFGYYGASVGGRLLFDKKRAHQILLIRLGRRLRDSARRYLPRHVRRWLSRQLRRSTR